MIVGQGGISAIYYSNRIIQFPMGVFSIALASAVLPSLSELASKKDTESIKHTIIFALENIFFVMAPTMVMILMFAVPIIRRLGGEDVTNPYLRPALDAYLTRNVPSREGRMDFVRVSVGAADGRLVAVPVRGKSGMISAMVRATGYICIAQDCEGLYKGDRVRVHLFSNWGEEYLEKEYLFGHEVAGGSSGSLFDASSQEKLSQI